MTSAEMGFVVVEYVDGEAKGYVFDDILDTLEDAEKIITGAEEFNKDNGYDGQVEYRVFRLEAARVK